MRRSKACDDCPNVKKHATAYIKSPEADGFSTNNQKKPKSAQKTA